VKEEEIEPSACPYISGGRGKSLGGDTTIQAYPRVRLLEKKIAANSKIKGRLAEMLLM